VIDLANGDNIVSAWVYEIDEREPAPAIVDYYTDLVDDWIFGHLRVNGWTLTGGQTIGPQKRL
jgi:hypothetical protein